MTEGSGVGSSMEELRKGATPFPVGDQSPGWLWFFEMEEVQAASVADHYQFKTIGKYTAVRRTIAGEDGEHLSRLHLPHLYGVVRAR